MTFTPEVRSDEALARWLDARAAHLVSEIAAGRLEPPASVSRRWEWRWQRAWSSGITKGNAVDARAARRINEVLAMDLLAALEPEVPRYLHADAIAEVRRTPDAIIHPGVELQPQARAAIRQARSAIDRDSPAR